MKLRVLLIIITFLTTTASIAKNKITLITTENYPPLNYIDNGNLTGSAVDIVQAIQNKIISTIKIKVSPWKRALVTTINTKNSAIFSIVRSKRREGFFKWVGPIATKKYSLYSLNNADIHLSSINQANNYSIGVQRGGFGEEYIKAKGLKNIFAVTSQQQNLKKLLNNRIDLWFINDISLDEQLKQMSIPRSQIKEILVVKQAQLYIGFNTQTSDDIVNLWQNTYQHLYQQGVIKKIYQQHHLLALYPKIKKFIP